MRRPFPIKVASVARSVFANHDSPGSVAACAAPSVQLHLAPDGTVSACCAHKQPLGQIGVDRLEDVWNGARRADLVDQLGRHDFGAGCESCGREIDLEGREGSLPAQYDDYLPGGFHDRADKTWPSRIDFMLSNACNLQCLQCSGEHSSAIRIHREHRPPIVDPYDDQFFDDLRAFIPHLDYAAFEGGEPFLSNSNFRVFDLIAELNPDLEHTVCTNGTQWSARIERVLRRQNMNLIFSLDGITPGTFERIRVGASFDRVMSNFAEMSAIVRARGGTVSINHCLMPSNYREFADMLLFGEEHDARVYVSVVRWPKHSSIWHLPQPDIQEISQFLDELDGTVRPSLTINQQPWNAELARIRQWATCSVDQLRTSRLEVQILDFPPLGTPLSDDEMARRDLEAISDDGVVLSIDVEPGDVIGGYSPALDQLLDVDPGSLRGIPAANLGKIAETGLGPFEDEEQLSASADRVDRVIRGPERDLHISVVPNRDSTGYARTARILVAVKSRPARSPSGSDIEAG